MGFQYFHLHESDVRTEMLNAWQEEWADLSANWPQDQRPYGKQLTDAGWAAFEQPCQRRWPQRMMTGSLAR